jgi:hypothetical protein
MLSQLFLFVNFISTAEVAEIIPGCYTEKDAELMQVNKTILLVRNGLIKNAKIER